MVSFLRPARRTQGGEHYLPLEIRGNVVDFDTSTPIRYENDKPIEAIWRRILPAISLGISVTGLLVALSQSGIVNGAAVASPYAPTPFKTPSAYVGLDRAMGIKTWKTDYPPIHSMPLTVVQISRENPYIIMPDDRPHKWTKYGTAFPDSRHFVVTDKVSTVFQSRTLDFGMEDCRVSVAIPPVRRNSFVPKVNSSFVLDIWKLDSSKNADYKHMTWSNRPRRLVWLGSFDITDGVNSTTENFPCPSGSLNNIELECSKCDYELDFWQEYYGNLPFIAFTQMSTY